MLCCWRLRHAGLVFLLHLKRMEETGSPSVSDDDCVGELCNHERHPGAASPKIASLVLKRLNYSNLCVMADCNEKVATMEISKIQACRSMKQQVVL